MKKLPSPLFMLLFTACVLTLFSAECQLATGNSNSGNADSGVVTLGLKGNSAAGTYVEATVDFVYQLEGTAAKTVSQHFKVTPDAAKEYIMKKSFTLKEGNYEFIIGTSTWISPVFQQRITAGKQTQIIWTNYSMAAPQVYIY